MRNASKKVVKKLDRRWLAASPTEDGKVTQVQPPLEIDVARSRIERPCLDEIYIVPEGKEVPK